MDFRGGLLRVGPPLLILLFGTHIFLTVRTAFMQRYLDHGELGPGPIGEPMANR